MNKIIIGLLILLVLLSGCATTYQVYDESNETIDKKAYDLCVEKGGVPIRSAWSGSLKNCIFGEVI